MFTDNKSFINIHPVIQFVVCLLLMLFCVIIHKISSTLLPNVWIGLCACLLFFSFCNCIIGIFQKDTIKYIFISILFFTALLFSSLLLGKMGIVESIRHQHSAQLLLVITVLFYIVITGVSQIVRLLYHLSKNI